MSWQVDHLVVGATSLEEGAAWCRATFGVEPAPGGRHALMGTHNRLLSISGPTHPHCYLEIIAIDPQAAPPGRTRWFDLDDAEVRADLARGPALLHWVARSANLHADIAALAAHGLDRGAIVAAERASADGLLRWRISVRDDGQRLCGGALPTLIEWTGPLHPAQALPPSGIALERLVLGALPATLQGRLPAGASSDRDSDDAGPTAALRATFTTPRGVVDLSSRRAR